MRQITRKSVISLALLGAVPAWATDYTAPLSPQQEDFKARFIARDEICRKQAMDQFSLSVERAEAFCVCEIDVIARNSNLKELASFTAAAIGTADQQGENAARARDLMSRLTPERKRVCGY
jgi:light-regulated signal transduction histidine kinase (bacteriophytochrome)